jgi:hypothetical protein
VENYSTWRLDPIFKHPWGDHQNLAKLYLYTLHWFRKCTKVLGKKKENLMDVKLTQTMYQSLSISTTNHLS